MCRHPHPDGKLLIIGGGIANFTNVADTLKGIIKAIKESEAKLKENNTKIYVRRGGPNYKEGLKWVVLLSRVILKMLEMKVWMIQESVIEW